MVFDCDTREPLRVQTQPAQPRQDRPAQENRPGGSLPRPETRTGARRREACMAGTLLHSRPCNGHSTRGEQPDDVIATNRRPIVGATSSSATGWQGAVAPIWSLRGPEQLAVV
jgi:hypothetical protein